MSHPKGKILFPQKFKKIVSKLNKKCPDCYELKNRVFSEVILMHSNTKEKLYEAMGVRVECTECKYDEFVPYYKPRVVK